MRFREFFLFGKRFVALPADAPFVLAAVEDGGEYIHQFTNVDEIEADGILYEVLYNETAE